MRYADSETRLTVVRSLLHDHGVQGVLELYRVIRDLGFPKTKLGVPIWGFS